MTTRRTTSRPDQKGSNDQIPSNHRSGQAEHGWPIDTEGTLLPIRTPAPLPWPTYADSAGQISGKEGDRRDSGLRRIRQPAVTGHQTLRELRGSLWLEVAELHHLAMSETLTPAG